MWIIILFLFKALQFYIPITLCVPIAEKCIPFELLPPTHSALGGKGMPLGWERQSSLLRGASCPAYSRCVLARSHTQLYRALLLSSGQDPLVLSNAHSLSPTCYMREIILPLLLVSPILHTGSGRNNAPCFSYKNCKRVILYHNTVTLESIP